MRTPCGAPTLALVVTPLRFTEYLAAKLLSLTALGMVISLALILITGAAGVNLPLALLGTALMSLIALLVGFIAVAPFASFSSYPIPSQLPALLLYLPVAALAGDPAPLYLAGGALYNVALIALLYRRYQRQFLRSG